MSTVLTLLLDSILEVQGDEAVPKWHELVGPTGWSAQPGQIPSTVKRALGGRIARITGTADPETFQVPIESALVHTTAYGLLSGAERSFRSTSEGETLFTPAAAARVIISATGGVTFGASEAPDPLTDPGWGVGAAILVGDVMHVLDKVDADGIVVKVPAAAIPSTAFSLVVPGIRYGFIARPSLAVAAAADGTTGRNNIAGTLTLELTSKLSAPTLVKPS